MGYTTIITSIGCGLVLIYLLNKRKDITNIFNKLNLSFITPSLKYDKYNEFDDYDEYHDEYDKLDEYDEYHNEYDKYDKYIKTENIERIANNCPKCLDENGIPTNDHGFRNCVKYRCGADEKLSKDIYFGTQLRENDEEYFFASGIIPYRIINNEIEILLIKEYRSEKLLYNYIGGKRDCYKKGNTYRLETSKETMISEFNEEMRSLLPEDEFINILRSIDKSNNKNNVMWWPKSKACIYLILVNNTISNNGWLKLNNIEETMVHIYVKPIISTIKNYLSTEI